MKKADIYLIFLFVFTVLIGIFYSPALPVGTIVIQEGTSSSSGSSGSSSSSSSGTLSACVVCEKPVCTSGQVLSPGSCSECPKCVDSSSSGSLNCLADDDCPPGVCPSGKTYQKYSCLDGKCHELNFFADPCQFLTSSSSGSFEDDCQCKVGELWDGDKCVAKTDEGACILLFDPVCGCDGMTYSNSCFANLSGLKKFTQGECTTTLSKNFTGIWKGRVRACPIQSEASALSSNDCVVCPIVSIFCAPGFMFVPDTCDECAHCEKCKGSNIITLRLCVVNGKLEGSVHQRGIFEKAVITTQSVISGNEVVVALQDKRGRTVTLTLKLLSEKQLLGTFDSGQTFNARKLNTFRRCIPSPAISSSGSINSSSSSGDFDDCGSRGSCRGENGEELPCPPGTECSGLPAYGCYPPGCPVPICCSADTNIRTPKGEVNISKVKIGDLVLSDGGEIVRITQVNKVKVKNHKVLHVVLDDGTTLDVSSNHPIGPNYVTFSSLMIGSILDRRKIVSIELIPYKYSFTYDILPRSPTGNYYANGVLIGSTLYKRR